MIDYHVHLWRHAPHLPLLASVDQLGAYCAHAARLGVTELAVTGHSSRFRQFDTLLRGWWDHDPSPARRAETSTCWDEELGADLDQYVGTALAAKAAGLPVVIGLEVDYVPGRMEKVAALLKAYPFDVLLGSVHWIGAWLFDALDWAQAQEQGTVGHPGCGASLGRLHDVPGRAGQHPHGGRAGASRSGQGRRPPPGRAR